MGYNRCEKIMKTGELIYSLKEVKKAADLIYQLADQAQVITFTGTLGAGKTTLIQALLRKAGVAGPVQSPTYAYLNQYQGTKWPQVNHFDLYRIPSVEDFESLGFSEYLYQADTKTLIEWPGVIMPLLQHSVCHITIDYQGLNERRLHYECTTTACVGY